MLETRPEISSRLPGFYTLPAGERAKITAQISALDVSEEKLLHDFGALSQELADTFIENAISAYALPLGIATNFSINGRDVLIPMAVEESSVVAAASHGAKLARLGGGFRAGSSEAIMTGQIQIYLPPTVDYAKILRDHKRDLIRRANAGQERLLQRGGGTKDITWEYITEIESLVLYIHVNTVDAMGANIINTIAEKLSSHLPKLFPSGELGLRILTNLNDRRMAWSECVIPPQAFHQDVEKGQYTIDRIVKAWEFAFYNVYRATTHNKGVMNGIDPVVIATGNDWRAIEASAHAYACKTGVYRPLTTWSRTTDGQLLGQIKLPMAVGTVGGVTKLHPTSQIALKILGCPNARELAEVICSVGLAQNLSALRALSAEGIQHGHMSLHQKNLDMVRKQRRWVQ